MRDASRAVRYEVRWYHFAGFLLENKPMMFHITIEQAEHGWIVAECPALPGCVSQGKNENEAMENIKEAITAWLWAEDQKAVPMLKTHQRQQPIMAAV